MKLNPDCVRDILLMVEEHSDYLTAASFTYGAEQFKKLNRYPLNTILYHITQCERSHLIYKAHIYGTGERFDIEDLTPEGHKFIENIRKDNIWSKIKSISGKIGSCTLDGVMQIATNVITELIKAELGLPH